MPKPFLDDGSAAKAPDLKTAEQILNQDIQTAKPTVVLTEADQTAQNVYQITDKDLAEMNASQNSFEEEADPFDPTPSLESPRNGEKPIEGEFLGTSVHEMCQWRYEIKNSEHRLSTLSFWKIFRAQNETLQKLGADAEAAKAAGNDTEYQKLKNQYFQYQAEFERFFLEKVVDEILLRNNPTDEYLAAYFTRYETYDNMKNVRSIAKYYNDNGFSFSSKKAYLIAEEFFNDTETKKYGDEYDQREFGGRN